MLQLNIPLDLIWLVITNRYVVKFTEHTQQNFCEIVIRLTCMVELRMVVSGGHAGNDEPVARHS